MVILLFDNSGNDTGMGGSIRENGTVMIEALQQRTGEI